MAMALLLTGGGERERHAHGEEQIESISIAKSRPWLEVLVTQEAGKPGQTDSAFQSSPLTSYRSLLEVPCHGSLT